MYDIPKHIVNLLNKKVRQYNHVDFIEQDPISIPHRFTQKQDIEIAAFFAALLAWGNRKSIIKSCNKLMQLMHNEPYNFMMSLEQKDIDNLMYSECFVHRTFNSIDLARCFAFLRHHYKVLQQPSLETAFTKNLKPRAANVEKGLDGFYDYFTDLELFGDYEFRTAKHIAAPFKKSACKRLNMFLRWMVRSDKTGVDFGLWKKIKPSQLVMPLDVHVLNVAKHLGVLSTNAASCWNNAVLLTNTLKELDAHDPVKYDYALFGIGVMDEIKKENNF